MSSAVNHDILFWFLEFTLQLCQHLCDGDTVWHKCPALYGFQVSLHKKEDTTITVKTYMQIMKTYDKKQEYFYTEKMRKFSSYSNEIIPNMLISKFSGFF